MPLSDKAAARKDRDVKPARFQHAHFTVLADILRSLPSPPFKAHDRKLIIEHFALQLSCHNPRFDRARFLAACGE